MLLYRLMVENTLQFLIEEVGEVEGVYKSRGPLAEKFAVRRAASHGIEAAGIFAFHASPVWVLAAMADLSGAGRSLIAEIADALRADGMLPKEEAGAAPFETVDQLLDGLEKSAGSLAQAVNMPPLNVAEMRMEWKKLQSSLPAVPGIEQLQRNWNALVETAAQQKVSVFKLSSLLALSAIRKLPANVWWLSRASRLAGRRTGEVLVETVLDHYIVSLREIHQAGYLKFWIREFEPYMQATVRQFSTDHITLTEKLLRKGKVMF